MMISSSGTDEPNAATMTSDSTLLGIEFMASISRLSASSIHRALTVATRARVVPIRLARPAAAKAALKIAGESDTARGVLSCTISAALRESTSDAGAIAATVGRELAETFPELRGARPIDSLVIKEKHATFEATPEAEHHRPPQRTQHEGFLLAGDWTATGLPATIEGAVVSGVEAGEIVGRRSLVADRGS